jgi:peptidyl-prolyl cis-trans isomerase D
MLQDMRKNAQGTAAKVIVGLIVISFAFFGLQSILLDGGGGMVAEVNGEEISPQELQQAEYIQTRRLIAMLGDNLDPQYLQEDRIRAQALEGIVSQRVLLQAATEAGLVISEKDLAALMTQIQDFQIDGTFSQDLYRQVLSDNGYTPATFTKNFAADMLVNQMRSGLASTDFATAAELRLNAAVLSEQRDFRYLTITGAQFEASVEISEADIESYYEERQDNFQTEESVDLEFITVSLDDFRAPVFEEQVREAYELALQDFELTDENRLSHILFVEGGQKSISERLATVQARISEGAAFNELAQEYSDDPGSANRGGDLGYSGGDAFPEEIERAITSLATGVVSEPVESEAGTHLLLLTERREATAPSFEELRAGLEESLQVDEARIEMLRVVESLKDLSFNAEDLQMPSSELNLEVEKVMAVTRTFGEGLFESAVLREAAFSEEVLAAGNNSDVIELAEGRYIVLRVGLYHESETRPIDDVRSQISAVLTKAAVNNALAVEAEALLEQLRAGFAMDAMAAEKKYEWQAQLSVRRQEATASPVVLARAFTLPDPGEGHSSDFILTDSGDAVVIQLTKVRAGDLNTLASDEVENLRRGISRESGALLDSEFQQFKRQRADVVVL